MKVEPLVPGTKNNTNDIPEKISCANRINESNCQRRMRCNVKNEVNWEV